MNAYFFTYLFTINYLVVSVIEQVTDARQSYSIAIKNVCQSFKESVEKVESIK